MTQDLINHPSLDFTAYQPGDVISIPQHTIIQFGQAKSIMLMAAIANAATRAGLAWETFRREEDGNVCVRFSEL